MATKRHEKSGVKDHEINRKSKLTTSSGTDLGFICLIPFGWIALAVAMNNRKKEVINGEISQEVGLAVIKNYLVGFWVVMSLALLMVITSSLSTGIVHFPNIIALFVILIVYSNCKSTISDDEFVENYWRRRAKKEESSPRSPKTRAESTPKKAKRNKFISINIRDE